MWRPGVALCQWKRPFSSRLEEHFIPCFVCGLPLNVAEYARHPRTPHKTQLFNYRLHRHPVSVLRCGAPASPSEEAPKFPFSSNFNSPNCFENYPKCKKISSPASAIRPRWEQARRQRPAAAAAVAESASRPSLRPSTAPARTTLPASPTAKARPLTTATPARTTVRARLVGDGVFKKEAAGARGGSG